MPEERLAFAKEHQAAISDSGDLSSVLALLAQADHLSFNTTISYA